MSRLAQLTLAVALFLFASEATQAQRISIGVGGGYGGYGVGVGVGSGPSYGYYGRGYGARYGVGYGAGYYGPGYYYARPNAYWYGDRHWDRWGNYNDSYDNQSEQETERGDETPPLPSAEELSSMSWKHLRRVLNFGAGYLEDELDALKNGAGWKKLLQPGAIRDAVAEDKNAPLDAKTAEKLAKLRETYDSIADKTEYAAITRLWGFQATHAALSEITKPAWRRQQRQLAEASRALDAELKPINTGAGWTKHLALPQGVFAVLSEDSSETQQPQPDAAALGKALARFDAVQKNPEYKTIADLPSFKATHDLLAGYLANFVEAPAPPTLPPQ